MLATLHRRIAVAGVLLCACCAEYGGEQGFLGFASLPDAAAVLVETGSPAGPSPLESITQVTSTTITGTTTTTTIPTVDPSRSFVICSQTSLSSRPENVVTCQLTAGDEVTLSTHTVNSQVMSLSVVQFASGAAVQRGSTIMTTGVAAVDLPLSTITVGRSFVILRSRLASTDTTADQRRLVTPELANSTTLRLTRADSASDTTVEWQVVSLDAATVQSGAVTLANGTTTISVTPAAFTLNRSFVLSYARATNAVAGRENSYYVRNTLGATAVDFERQQSTGEVMLQYYLVSMGDSSTVQHGNLPIEAAYSNTPFKTAGITPVNLSRSVALVSTSIEQPGDAASSSDQDSGLWRVALQDASTVELQRSSAETNRTGTLQWQVVEFQN